MDKDLERFRELLLTDENFQEKLKNALEAYDGGKTQEEIFNNVLVPVADEYGITASFDEFKFYLENLNDAEMTKDELTQVAGGKGINGGGIGVTHCTVLGGGIGVVGTSEGGGACMVVGFGWGDQICYTVGVSDNDD